MDMMIPKESSEGGSYLHMLIQYLGGHSDIDKYWLVIQESGKVNQKKLQCINLGGMR